MKYLFSIKQSANPPLLLGYRFTKHLSLVEGAVQYRGEELIIDSFQLSTTSEVLNKGTKARVSNVNEYTEVETALLDVEAKLKKCHVIRSEEPYQLHQILK